MPGVYCYWWGSFFWMCCARCVTPGGPLGTIFLPISFAWARRLCRLRPWWVFLIGVVIAYLLALQLRQFGADAFIVDILGISLTRELGPLLAAILVAGRSGSAITAQIGVMRVNEELDAMRVMGIAHGYRLVLPRVMAMALAMPLVSLWTTLAALLGGVWASSMALDIAPAFFAETLPQAVDIANLWLGMGKSVVFGMSIALIGCYWGLWVKPNTESLGSGTTASVVTSITAVIVIDAVFAIIFRNVGF